jgi:choline dehydrogenase-like flavoprotein
MSLNRPESRGSIRLRSRDPFEKPIIDARYLDRGEDVSRLIEGKLGEHVYWIDGKQQFVELIEFGLMGGGGG